MGRPPCFVVAALLALAFVVPACAQSVLQYHNSGSRNGLYVDPLFNVTNVPTLALDTSFNVSIPGPVYAQLLYLASSSLANSTLANSTLANGTLANSTLANSSALANSSLAGRDAIFVATEQNQVLAIDASNGTILWNRTLVPPVNGALLLCGNINPAGITGTPVLDPQSGVIVFVSLTSNGTLASVRSLAWALNIANGTVLPGWPIDIQAALTARNKTFIASNQQQRGGLTLLNGTVYIPYGGLNGDCAQYYGVVVGIPLRTPSALQAYVSIGYKGGLWATPGVSTDGFNIFGATGNTGGLDNFTAPEVWSGGEALLRLQPGPVFTNTTRDFFAPANWQALDDADTDIGSSGALLVDLPGATPPTLALAMGKNGVVYLANRNNLGGVGGQLFQAQVSSGVIISTPVAYNVSNTTYVALGGRVGVGCPVGQTGDIVGLQLRAGNPPNFTVAWCASSLSTSRTALIVTSPDGNTTATVWVLGTGGLRGFDGVTGRVVFNGTAAFPLVREWQTPIVSKGRLYFADDKQLYSFKVAAAPQLPVANNSSNSSSILLSNATLTRGPVVIPNGTLGILNGTLG